MLGSGYFLKKLCELNDTKLVKAPTVETKYTANDVHSLTQPLHRYRVCIPLLCVHRYRGYRVYIVSHNRL